MGGKYQSIHFTVMTDLQKIETLREKVLDSISGGVEMMGSRVRKLKEKGKPLSETEKHRIAIFSGVIRNVEMAKEGHDVIFWDAPVVIVLHGEAVVRFNQWNADVIAMCMILMAESLGLGTCFLGYLPLADEADGESLREFINLLEGPRIFQGLIMGYPGLEFIKAPGRKPAIVNWM
jgi:nitroreductase